MIKISYPKYLSIQTTSLCNGHCVFCPYDEIRDLFPKKIMGENLFKKIIDECSRYREIERIILYLNNEPLTDPYLVERINYAKEKVPWASVHILTNGSLLTEELTDRLINSKLDWIGFSLHGVRKETIEKAMGINYDLTFRQTSGFIKKAKTKKDIKDFIMVTFLRHKHLTLEEKEETIKFWQEKGIERISYFDGPLSRAGNVKDLPQVRHNKIKGCTSIWADEMMHIVENGDVVLCCMDWRREVILGNIKTKSIYEIWNSQKYVQIRDKRDGRSESEDNFICKRCEAAVPSQKSESFKIGLQKQKPPDILLVMCPMWAIDMPPLGISYLASYLEHKGFNIEILDINIELHNKTSDEDRKLWDMQKYSFWSDEDLFHKHIKQKFQREMDTYVEHILSRGIKIIGFSLYGANILFSIEVAKALKAKNPELTIIFGGPSCFWLDKNCVMPSSMYSVKTGKPLMPTGLVDIFVKGEGEITLEEILITTQNKKEYLGIPGTIVHCNGRYSSFVSRDLVKNLDVIPFPALHKFPLSLYTGRRLPILMNRGCIRRCNFCNDYKISGLTFRMRSAQNIFEEIRYNVQRYGIENLQFCDLVVNGDIKELEKLCDLLIKSNLKIKWTGQTVIRKDMGYPLLKKMRRSGCQCLTYGVESFSDSVLNKMNKPYNSTDAKLVLENTKKAKVGTTVNLIVGFPGEGEDEFKETIKFLKDNYVFIDEISSLSPCYVTGGTELEIHPTTFAIRLPAKEWWFNWETEDGENTYLLRKEKTKKLVGVLRELKIPVRFVGIYDEDKDIKETEETDHRELKIIHRKSADVLLVICPPWGVDAPPLGISSISTYLRSKGFGTKIFDFNIYLYNKTENKYKYLWEMGSALEWRDTYAFDQLKDLFKDEIEFCVEKIISSQIDVVGFSVLSNSQDRITAEIIKRIKKRKPYLKIILGGTSVSVDEQRVFFEENLSCDLIDIFVMGEGEEIIYKVLEAYTTNRDIGEIKEVSLFKERGFLCIRSYLKDNLDDFGFPTFEEFDLDSYANKGKGLLMEWSRGCIGNCSFCAFKVISGTFRRKNIDAIHRAILYYKDKHDISHLSLVDSAINCDLTYLENICDFLIETNTQVEFSALAMPRREMDFRFIEKMRKAGFQRLEYGVESGSTKILKAMNKLFSAEDAEQAIRLTHEAGIMTVIYLIVGFPGEKEVEFNETLDFLSRNAPYIDLVKSVNPLYLMAGLPIHKNHKHYGIKLSEENPDFKWRIDQENNYEIRLAKVNKIREKLNELRIKYFTEDNQFERKTGLMPQETSAYHEDKEGKLDILLVTLPPWGVENPPLGLGYLDAYLRSRNLRTEILDFNIYFFNTIDPKFKMLWHVENKNYWSNEKIFPLICELFRSQIDYAADKILAYDTNLIGFSVVDPKEKITIELIKKIKKEAPKKKIVLGGPACSTEQQRDFFIENIPGFIDYFVVGEGEETLYEIIQKEKNNSKIFDLAGLAIRENGKWRYNSRQPIYPLDKIPFPIYEDLNLSQYNGGKSFLVEWSRGCLGRCGFCKNYRLVSGYRSRNAENILKELEFLLTHYCLEEITVCDNIMNGDIRQLNEVSEKITQKGLKIKWSGQIAPRKEMDADLFNRMFQAGCHKIQIGVESGSAHVLKRMRKTYTPEIAEQSIRMAKKAGIEIEIFIMVGFPGETEKEFRKTYDFIKRNAGYIDTIKSINTLHLIAGTEVYENYQKYNLKLLPEKNWHYLWETYDGNIYEVRKQRVERLLDLASDLGIKVLEANIKEGKEELFPCLGEMNLATQLERLKLEINSLQELPQRIPKPKIIKKVRSPFKVTLLGFIFIYTLFYITYFWLFKRLKGKTLLGGS